jgi:hypothetical protein
MSLGVAEQLLQQAAQDGRTLAGFHALIELVDYGKQLLMLGVETMYLDAL